VRALRSAGLPLVDRSPYDAFMLHFHDWLKGNSRYQNDCAKYRFDLPPASTWLVFTDVVPHAVLGGRYALEQTVIIRRKNLLDPSKAPASILERMCGRTLTA
jgi:3-deoxy-D-manno-oct-2-ulosonic acid (Kdo) hydroxylase